MLGIFFNWFYRRKYTYFMTRKTAYLVKIYNETTYFLAWNRDIISVIIVVSHD